LQNTTFGSNINSPATEEAAETI